MSSPPSPADPFAGISDSWGQLTAWLSAAQPLPPTVSAFAARYGAFDDADEVARFVAAVAGVRALSRDAGGPAALKQELVTNPDVVVGAAPPASLYDRLVWLAGRVSNAADSAAATLDGIATLATGDAATRAQTVKTLLAGPGGLVPTFSEARRLAEALTAALDAFGARVATLSRGLLETKLINQANIVIGALNSANRRLSEAAQADRSRSSLSRSSEPATDPADQIAANTAEIARKQALIDDSAALLAAAERVNVVIPGVSAAVAALALRFQRAANQLLQFSAISTVAQLSDAAWVSQALDLPAMTSGWRGVVAAAQSFTQQSLVEPNGGQP